MKFRFSIMATALRICALLVFTVLVSCGHDNGKATSSPAPAILTVGQPQTGTVARLNFNAYAAAVTPGALYKISMTNPTSDTDLLVYGTDSTYTTLTSCAIDNTSIIGISPEDCVIVAPASTLYFGIDGTFITPDASTYTIDIELLPKTNLALSLPILDSTTQTGAKIYTASVSPGATYTVGITGLSDDADLHVFGNDGTFTAPAACSIDNTRFTGTTPEDCTWTSSAGTLYFIVDGIFSSSAALQYTALATPTPVIPVPSNEGTAGRPAAIALNTPTAGQVAQAGTSYYEATGLSAGTRYTISIFGLTANANLQVFGNDNTFTSPANCVIDNTTFADTTPEDCTIVSPASTMYFSVASKTTSGGVAFITLIEPGP